MFKFANCPTNRTTPFVPSFRSILSSVGQREREGLSNGPGKPCVFTHPDMEPANTAEQSQAKPLGLGDRLGNYVLERQLGEGSQAEVYLARDVVLQREVAIKILHRGSDDSGEPNLEGLEEARLIASLEHTHVVRVYHVGRTSGVWYMAMEHVGGNSLRKLVGRRGVLEPIEALRCIRAAADALTCVHGIGLLHRDVKPHNLLMTYTGVVKLVDFGLAAWDPHNLAADKGPIDTRRVGTPEYLAPEVWCNKGATVQSDIYSLGATLYFLLVGRAPFIGKTIESQRGAHLEKEPPIPEELSPIVRALILRCMAKKPADRPATARDLVSDVDHTLRVLTGDRRATSIAPMWTDLGAINECLPGLRHEDRETANTAVLSLPSFVSALKRLEGAMFASQPIILFHGECQVLSRIVRLVRERRSSELYVVSRVVLLADRDSLTNVLCERFKVVPSKTAKAFDLIAKKLSEAASRKVNIRSILHVYVPTSLRPIDCNALAEVVTRLRSQDMVALIVCESREAEVFCHELDSLGHASLMAEVSMPKMSAQELEKYVETWTELSTQSRLLWTPDAHRLLRHAYYEGRAPLDHLVHNSVVLTLNAGERLVTTWQVCGAYTHQKEIQSIDEITPNWRKRPTTWPNDETRSMLEALRGNADSAKS